MSIRRTDERMQGLQANQKPNDIASHLLVDKKSGLGKIPYEATLDDFRLIVIAGR